MNQKLQDAVNLFKELGWENVTAENILQLPVGTPEQKRTALAGLKSGEWGGFVEIKKNTYGYRSNVDVDESKLSLFAVRVGVDAGRAVNILRGSSEILIKVIAERGAKYALDFISHACISSRRGSEHSASAFGSVVVLLVDKLNLDIPQNVEYMKDWSWCADSAMDLKDQTELAGISHFLRFDRRNNRTDLPGIEFIEKRFIEHIVTGVSVNTPATGFFGIVFAAGVKRGWLPRDKAVALVFSALDAAVRPGDRKVWLAVLDELKISDKELCSRAQALIPLMASGDSFVIDRLAPVLIAGAGDALLAEVLMSAFAATAKKTKQLVLRAALNRFTSGGPGTGPKNTEELAPWLSILAGDKDKTVASLAAKLIEQWGLESSLSKTDAALPAEKAVAPWQKTPPLWQVPSFELLPNGKGEISPEALTELAAEMVNRPEAHDAATERFLAAANAVAYKNPEAARTSLRGLRRMEHTLLSYAIYWVKGEKPDYAFDTSKNIREPLTARDCMVFCHLDKLPCLLSTPSKDDLSISVSDLASRLELYKKTGTDALEADLFLALTRLDIKTKTPEAAKALQKLDVPVVLQSGEKMPAAAGDAVLRYLDDPIQERSLKISKYGYMSNEEKLLPESMRDFPKRFNYYLHEAFSVLPCFGDMSLRDVRWDSEVYHDKGLVLRQVARRAAPLPPGAAINILTAQRSSTPDAAADSLLAVKEAWERGLLRPGVADAALLDWSSGEPSNLAALAAALEGIARDGMLSVVWPVLDDLIAASLKAPRLLVGTAELAELVEAFLPEAQSAVEKGLADKGVLDLPGIRALALRGGSSRAVSSAQKIASQLPAQIPSAETVLQKAEQPAMEKPFTEIWPARKEAAALIDDGASITVDWANPNDATKFFLFTLTLPGIRDHIFHVVKSGWYYDLETEGQCDAYSVTPGTTGFARDKEKRVWLHWDIKQKAMVICDNRNWAEKNDGPLDRKNIRTPPLPISLLTVIIGSLAQDGDAIYYAPSLLNKFIKSGQIDDEVVRRATLTLLKYPVVSPAKLARSLEKDLKLLPTLWPMLTESVKAAGALAASGEKPPVWINRVLDIAVRYAPYLKEAAKRGLVPAKDAEWKGLSEIASSKAKSTAVDKAKKLLAILK